MRRVAYMAIGAVALSLLIVASAASMGATTAQAAEATRANRVVLVLAPYLSWSDVTEQTTPTLYRLANEGAVGDINVNNRNRSAGQDTPDEGALTFSAGSWAAADPLAPAAYSVGEYYEGGTSAEAFERMTGVTPAGNEVVFLGMPRTQRLNAAYTTLEVVVGTLGQTIVDAGGVTAAVGNSDSGYEVRGLWRTRPAAMVAMDAEGRVRVGDVSTNLLVNDPDSPFGFRTDLELFQAAYATAEERLSEIGGPSLIVLDSGDLQRAYEFAPEVAPAVADKHHAAAVETLDHVVAIAAETLPEDAVLIVAPQVGSYRERSFAGLGPIVVSGSGWQGYVTSSSTQREGLVTNLDMAATVLDLLGIEVPTRVLGNPMKPDGSTAALEQRIAQLTELNESAIAIDTAKPAILNGYITFTTLLLLAGTFLLLRARRWMPGTVRANSWFFRKTLLLVLAVPVASTLMFVFDERPETAEQAIGMFAGVTLVVWGVGLLLERFARLRVAVAALSLMCVVTMLVDQWLGAPLSFSSFLGYSPLLAARYYGMGNEGAALLFGAALVGLSYVFDEYRDSSWTPLAARWGLPVVGLVVVATAAAPFWGANVGVAAWGVVGFAVAWALMNGYSLSWRLLFVVLLIIAVLVVAFSVVDLTAGEGSQTHLARAWSSASSGGIGELWLIVVRKAETNLRVLTRTNWSYLLVAVLGFLGFMRWRPQGDFAATLDENPYFSAAMAASLIGGAAAYLTEDSGIVIPALIMLYVGAGILYLMMSRLVAGDPPAHEVAEDPAQGVSSR